MTLTACLRLARALPLNSGAGAQQRHAYVGHRTPVSIPRHRVWNMDRRTGVQSLSCAATRGTDSRCTGAVTPAERIYQLAGREFEIGKPSVLAKVGAVFVFSLAVRVLAQQQRMFLIEDQNTNI